MNSQHFVRDYTIVDDDHPWGVVIVRVIRM